MAVETDLAVCCRCTAAEAFLGTPCRSQGCLEGGCELCAQNPSRRCSDNFSAKYLSGDSLLARCGASIRVEVIDRVTGDAVQDDSLASVQLEVGQGLGLRAAGSRVRVCLCGQQHALMQHYLRLHPFRGAAAIGRVQVGLSAPQQCV